MRLKRLSGSPAKTRRSLAGLLLPLLYLLLVVFIYSLTGRLPTIDREIVRTILDITGVLIGFGGIVLSVVPLYIRGAIQEIASIMKDLSEPLAKGQWGIQLIEQLRSISPQLPDTVEKLLRSQVDRLSSEVDKMRQLVSTYETIHKKVVESSLMMLIYFVLVLVVGFIHMGYFDLMTALPPIGLIMMTIELFFLSLGIGRLLTMISAFMA